LFKGGVIADKVEQFADFIFFQAGAGVQSILFYQQQF